VDSPIKVLVVDDNACMVLGLKHLIDSERPAMVLADTVTRAGDVLRSVRQHQPDVVLLEIDVGEESGLELISLVNEGGAAKIIIFTGNRNAALHEQAILAGAHGLVLKSEPVNVVLRAIEAVHAGELWLKRDVTAKIVGMMTAAYHQSSPPHCNSLFTPSETRVVAAAVKFRGAPNKIIADVLHMSPNTFRNHLSAIYLKLGIHRRLDLVLYGIQHGLAEQANDAAAQGVAATPHAAPVATLTPTSFGDVGLVAVPNAEPEAQPCASSGADAELTVERPKGGWVDHLGRGPLTQSRPGISVSGQFQGSAPVRLIKASLRTATTTGATRR
jgi:two-component system, NarL family, nitrate/nitrite response regulator NarL